LFKRFAMEEIKIVFEDKDLMVVEKPPLMTTTKEKKGENGTLEDCLKKNRPNNLPRNGILHRLDKGTSGLIMVAKTEEAFLGLKKQFKERSLTKKYYCLVGGETPFEGEIDMPIARSKYSFSKFGVNEEGKRALTKFTLVRKYRSGEKIYSLLDIDLKTGRTHQIRVHLSYLRWPLVGDKTYGGEEINGLKRPFLHAYKIIFKHPVNKGDVEIKIDLPKDLTEVLNKYEKF